nr:hypothetical protein B0A51_01523 [Rachicladosporium sp. CCFEE 5018]
MAPPTTTKAARAAYKSRSCTNVLSDREKKRLERAALLERRAWGVKEREKRKVEAAKKRAELEKEEREERSMVGTKATQRARDRFGFRGSQRCLGAWFGDQRKVDQRGTRGADGTGMAGEVWDNTDDEGLMECLEEALNADRNPREAAKVTTELAQEAVPRNACRDGTQSVTQPHEVTRNDSVLDDDWDDELLSDYIPTQCAPKTMPAPMRPTHVSSPMPPAPQPPSVTTSFGCIDLTEEDLDALDATILASSPIKAVYGQPRIIMPPPALPSRTTRPDPQRDKAKKLSRSVSLPMSARQTELGMGSRTPSFTLTQLESFVEEDLQLTQM